MSDDNTAINTEYEELEVQRSNNPLYDGDEIESSYMTVKISLFGRVFIGLMICSFIFSLLFLMFSYTSYGRTFLRGLDLSF